MPKYLTHRKVPQELYARYVIWVIAFCYAVWKLFTRHVETSYDEYMAGQECCQTESCTVVNPACDVNEAKMTLMAVGEST